jgi:hypothetical protein
MSLGKRHRHWLAFAIRGERPPASRRRGGVPPGLERLEDRTVLSSYTASSVSELIADINASNKAGGSNTITLAPGKTFTLTAVDNTTDGASGLPVIASGDSLTIVGNGDTVERSTGGGTPAFRLLDVAGGASLSLSGLTLQGGLASGAIPAGGAILSRGSLSLSGVTVQSNIAQGGVGNVAEGGGISSSGSLTAQNCTVTRNQAIGGDASSRGQNGGSGAGGGLYVSGTAGLTNVTLSSNTAKGGKGGSWFSNSFGKIYPYGGSAFGGGMYVEPDATVDVHGSAVTGNTAVGGKAVAGGSDGHGFGGGLYISQSTIPPACLDAFTVAHIIGNKADIAPDIYGSYTSCP